MLKKLDFKVTFSSTGREIVGSHDFKIGMTAISGANETGKSMRIEMIRYALFGSAALRSALSNYEKISCTLDFRVGESFYKIERTNHNVKLSKNGKQLASGTKAVNNAIIRIFGYGLDVFDTANACLQGEVESLTNKTPADRRRMVDKVIGLQAIHELAGEYSTEVSQLHKTINTLSGVVSEEPHPPMEPAQYVPSVDLKNKLSVEREKLKDKIKMQTELKVLFCEEPVAPQEKHADKTTEELEEKLKVFKELKYKLQFLTQQISSSPPNSAELQKDLDLLQLYVSSNQPEAWETYNEYRKNRDKFFNQNLVGLTQKDLENFKEAYLARKKVEKHQELSSGATIECPACTNVFYLNQKDIEKVKCDLPAEDFDYISLINKAQTIGMKSEYDFELFSRRLEEHDAFCVTDAPLNPLMNYICDKDQIEIRIKTLKLQLEQIELKTQKEKELLEIRNLVDSFEPKNIEQIVLEKAQDVLLLKDHSLKMEKWQSYVDLSASFSIALAELEGVENNISELEDQLNTSLQYENDVSNYTMKYENWLKINTQIQQLTEEMTKNKNIRKALEELKPKVKSYLLPSLARVSSNFLSQMTNNQRRLIDIDANFEIKVDGQPVETLSGSGKAVANLALRLGLGTVLTNKVFSVLLADEIDASMDEERSKYTAQCLRNLTKTFAQIILVSHHKAEADHQITL